jgi:protein-S-isoprenylcysteine O-methyltransferase Ste14
MQQTRILPPTYLLVGLCTMGLLHFFLSGPRLIWGPWRFAGIVLAVMGVVLTVWADALFKKYGTEVKPFRNSIIVVKDGPFRRTRHPMYLGFMGIVFGAAIIAGTLLPLLLVGAMFWLFSVLFVIPEERHMEEQFGEEYRQYRSEVRRWL